jgi:hypothetical protein
MTIDISRGDPDHLRPVVIGGADGTTTLFSRNDTQRIAHGSGDYAFFVAIPPSTLTVLAKRRKTVSVLALAVRLFL